MGNWRTVNMTGTMTAADAATLRGELEYDWRLDADRMPDPDVFCLAYDSRHPGLSGLGEWPAEKVNRNGNLHERDYTVADVAGALRKLITVAPSMMLVVHCGGEYESVECVATIRTGEGLVVVRDPEVEMVVPPSEMQIMRNFAANLGICDMWRP